MGMAKPMPSRVQNKLSGLILAGGEGRRMAGRDKGLITLANKPLVEYAITCLQPLVDDLAISCNRNQKLYQNYQLDCLTDAHLEQGFQGPMAGLASGLKHAKHDWLLVMPCDTPLMTTAVMSQLVAYTEATIDHDNPQGIIFSYQGLQPLHGVYHKSMLPIFEQCLADNKNALQRLLRSMPSIKLHNGVESELQGGHYFNNANDPEELAMIEELLNGH